MMNIDNLLDYRDVAFPPYKKTIDPYLSRAYRPISLRISWVLYHRNISPNSVTYAQICLGLLGSLIICFSQSLIAVSSGILLLHFAYLLDCIDGEIARAKQITSVTGIFLDKFAHAITMPAIFMSAAVFFSQTTDNALLANTVLILSWLAGVATFNPSSRLLLTVVDAMMRKQNIEQYSVENYAQEFHAADDTSGSGGLLQAIKATIKLGSSSSFPLFVALNFFRHVTYLAMLTLLMLMLAINIPVLVCIALWIGVCLAVIVKEMVYFYMVVTTPYIVERYFDVINHIRTPKDDVF